MSEAPGSNNSGLLHRVIKITPRVILYVRPAFPVARGESVAAAAAVIEGPPEGGGVGKRETRFSGCTSERGEEPKSGAQIYEPSNSGR